MNSSTNGARRSGQLLAKKIKLDHHLTPHTRINSKWLKDADISCDTTKIPEENLGSKISDIPCSNIFADISPMRREIMEKDKQKELHQLKNFCTAKENISKMKREPTAWENIFANDASDKGLISFSLILQRCHRV